MLSTEELTTMVDQTRARLAEESPETLAVIVSAIDRSAIRRMPMFSIPTDNQSIFGGSDEDHGN
jgi:hypothetical protein